MKIELLAAAIGAAGIYLASSWAAEPTEYFAISRENLQYCNEYARAEALDMPGMNKAYEDCIRVLPFRLPISGTVPATDRVIAVSNEQWEAACAAEYRTWDPDTKTVVRRGSPERVRCPCGEEVQCRAP